jgi:hypothetical protein
MKSNRDRIRLTRDGRPEVGVYIEKNKFGMHVAQVLVANREEPVTREGVGHRVLRKVHLS